MNQDDYARQRELLAGIRQIGLAHGSEAQDRRQQASNSCCHEQINPFRDEAPPPPAPDLPEHCLNGCHAEASSTVAADGPPARARKMSSSDSSLCSTTSARAPDAA